MLKKNCIVCGDEFIKPPSCGLPEWESRRKCCSKQCENVRRKGKNFSPSTQFTKERHYIPPTAIKPGQHLAPQTQFKKGLIPWNKGTKGLMPTPWNKGQEWPENSGEKHYNWKGGRTELRVAIRQLFKYKQWRTAVFQRDDYTCQMCGARRSPGNRVVIHADHIKPFYKIMDEHGIMTLEEAKNCEELWDVANGRTLCVPCHKQTDTYLVNQYTK